MRPTRDVRTLSEFRSNASAFVAQVRATSEPIFLTQRGRAAAVLVDIRAYETLIDEVGVIQDVQLAERQARRGAGFRRCWPARAASQSSPQAQDFARRTSRHAESSIASSRTA